MTQLTAANMTSLLFRRPEHMENKRAVSGLWGVLWRAAVYFPLAVLFLLVFCAAIVLIVCLPLLTILSVCSSDGSHAAAFAVGWIPVFAFLRWWWRRERSGKNWGVL